jgi:hypothetical protein
MRQKYFSSITEAMHRAFTLIIFIAAFIGTVARSHDKRSYKIHRLPSIADKSQVGLDLCPECINEAVSAINVLVNLIFDEGVIGSCGDLCGALANKTGSKDLGTVCTLVCDAVGIDEFIKLLLKSDVDPILYCQIAKLCPSKKERVVRLDLTENLFC